MQINGHMNKQTVCRRTVMTAGAHLRAKMTADTTGCHVGSCVAAAVITNEPT